MDQLDFTNGQTIRQMAPREYHPKRCVACVLALFAGWRYNPRNHRWLSESQRRYVARRRIDRIRRAPETEG